MGIKSIKNKLYILSTIILFFSFFINNCKATEGFENTGGGGTSTGSGGGSGNWTAYTDYVGVKIGILDSSGSFKGAKILLNKKCDSCVFSKNQNSKPFQGTNIDWITGVSTIKSNNLPSSWKTNPSSKEFNFISLYTYLTDSNNEKFKVLIKETNLKPNADDWIIIEPMIRINNYYGTAFELSNAFLDDNDTSEISFQFNMNKAYFAGNTNNINGGLFYNTIYVTNDTTIGNLTMLKRVTTQKCNPDQRELRNNCFKDKYCGSGVGLYKYSDIDDSKKYTRLNIKKYGENNGENWLLSSDDSKTFSISLYNDNKCTSLIKEIGIALPPKQYVKSGTTINISQYITKNTTIYIKETTAPEGFETDKTCHSLSIKYGETNYFELVNSKNEKSCESRAKDTKGDVAARIALYEEYRSQGMDYRNLLNFNSTPSKCGSSSCTNAYPMGCLTLYKTGSNISDYNLSCYDTREEINGNTAYCKIEYSLNTNLYSTNTDEYIFSNAVKNFENVTSGSWIFYRDINSKKIAEGILTKHCYIYGKNSVNSSNVNINYDDYIGNVTLKDVTLNSSKIESEAQSIEKITDNYYFASTTIQKDYELPQIFLKYGTGEKSSQGNNVGYGILSNFTDLNDINMPFEIEIKKEILRDQINSFYSTDSLIYFSGNKLVNKKSCNYNADFELIEPDELNLEFRLISRSNPFPGKNGNGRKVGSNWCYFDNCTTTDNNMITKYITNKNDSYNSTGAGAKYVINLNSTSIKYIKETYKDNAYDDFETECDTTKGTCAINFINDLKNKGYLTISNNTSTDDVLYGDVDENGIVNKKDSLYLKEYLERTQTLTEQGKKNADMSADGIIDEKDYQLLKNKLAGN